MLSQIISSGGLTTPLANTIYARLDGANQPFTGNLTISNTSPTLNFQKDVVEGYVWLDHANNNFYLKGFHDGNLPTNVIIQAGQPGNPDVPGGILSLTGGAYLPGGDLLVNGFIRTGTTLTSWTLSNNVSGQTTTGQNVGDLGVDGALYVTGISTVAGGIGVQGKLCPSNYVLLGSGEQNAVLGIDRHSSSSGKTFTVQAGWAASGVSNTNAGDLILAPGKATGTGTGSVQIQAVGGGVSGSANSTPSTVMTWGLTSGTFRTLGYTFISDTITGVKFGSATTQKFSFYNATPVAQQGATTDLGTALSNFGIRAAGTAYPITTSGAISFSGTFGSSGISSFTNGTDSSSTSTGGLIVSGGVGIAKSLYAGTSFFSTASVIAGGSAGYIAKVGGVIFDSFADVNNSGTTETDLITNTIPASTLVSNGAKLSSYYAGIFTGAASSTQQLKVYYGGTAIYDSGALSIGAATNYWIVRVNCIRVSSSVVRCNVDVISDFGTVFPYSKYTEVTGLTLTNTQVLKITGTAAGAGAASNQITSKQGSVRYDPPG